MRYWHSYFVGALRKGLPAELFDIEEEVSVGDVPLKIDVAVVRKKAEEEIPLGGPFGYFAAHNLIEFKSPEDYFSPRDYDRLVAYGLLYLLKYRIPSRGEITLTAVTAGYPRAWVRRMREEGVELEEKEAGIYLLDREFRFTLVVANRLEIKEEHFYLLPFSKGRHLIEYLRTLLSEEVEGKEWLLSLNLDLYPEEVLRMESVCGGTLPPVLQRKFEKAVKGLSVDRLVHLMGVDRLVDMVGVDRLVDTVGREEVIRQIGAENLQRDLIRMLGKEKMRELLEEMD